MNKIINRALATAFAVALVFGSSTFALANHGNGNGNNGNGHGKAHVKSAHANNAHGNSATAHSCINPAGNTRGWCKSQAGADYMTGTVTSVNGNTATVMLSNGQSVTVNANGLTIGQRVTVRGTFGTNGVFVPSGTYSNYGGPYSSASVHGLIISVSGNSIQIVQGLSIVTVDASNAVSRGAVNGTLIPGRTITAYGNWSGSTFVATSIQ
jgi:hypothetical protein